MPLGKMRAAEVFVSVQTCFVVDGNYTLANSTSVNGAGKPSTVERSARVRHGAKGIDLGAV